MTAVKGYFGIGLDNPKNPINVDAVLRAAGVFGAAFVGYSGKRYSAGPADTMRASNHLPVFKADDLHALIPFNCVPVAIELLPGAVPLDEYRHPERAFYVFGQEDGTLGARVLGWCRDVVCVPSNGCLNLAACANVVMYDRLAKQRGFVPSPKE